MQDNYIDQQKLHDIRAAFRFLDNLYLELSETQDLSDLKHPAVLKKFAEVIATLKAEVNPLVE